MAAATIDATPSDNPKPALGSAASMAAMTEPDLVLRSAKHPAPPRARDERVGGRIFVRKETFPVFLKEVVKVDMSVTLEGNAVWMAVKDAVLERRDEMEVCELLNRAFQLNTTDPYVQIDAFVDDKLQQQLLHLPTQLGSASFRAVPLELRSGRAFAAELAGKLPITLLRPPTAPDFALEFTIAGRLKEMTEILLKVEKVWAASPATIHFAMPESVESQADVTRLLSAHPTLQAEFPPEFFSDTLPINASVIILACSNALDGASELRAYVSDVNKALLNRDEPPLRVMTAELQRKQDTVMAQNWTEGWRKMELELNRISQSMAGPLLDHATRSAVAAAAAAALAAPAPAPAAAERVARAPDIPRQGKHAFQQLLGIMEDPSQGLSRIQATEAVANVLQQCSAPQDRVLEVYDHNLVPIVISVQFPHKPRTQLLWLTPNQTTGTLVELANALGCSHGRLALRLGEMDVDLRSEYDHPFVVGVARLCTAESSTMPLLPLRIAVLDEGNITTQESPRHSIAPGTRVRLDTLEVDIPAAAAGEVVAHRIVDLAATPTPVAVYHAGQDGLAHATALFGPEIGKMARPFVYEIASTTLVLDAGAQPFDARLKLNITNRTNETGVLLGQPFDLSFEGGEQPILPVTLIALVPSEPVTFGRSITLRTFSPAQNAWVAEPQAVYTDLLNRAYLTVRTTINHFSGYRLDANQHVPSPEELLESIAGERNPQFDKPRVDAPAQFCGRGGYKYFLPWGRFAGYAINVPNFEERFGGSDSTIYPATAPCPARRPGGRDYCVGFHGTQLESVADIVRNGLQIRAPRPDHVAGVSVSHMSAGWRAMYPALPHHETDAMWDRAIFLSPSCRYAAWYGQNCITLRTDGPNHWVRTDAVTHDARVIIVVLQCRVNPDALPDACNPNRVPSFFESIARFFRTPPVLPIRPAAGENDIRGLIFSETYHGRDAVGRIDPNYSNNELEWRLTRSDDIVPYRLLISALTSDEFAAERAEEASRVLGQHAAVPGAASGIAAARAS